MQFASTLLEICVGMIAVYTALSLFVSWVNEQIATLLNLRGKTLKNGVAQMISDAGIHQAVFDHPLIASSATPRAPLPSYLTATQFSGALLSVIDATPRMPSDLQGAFQDLTADVAAIKDDKLRTTLTALLNTAGGDFNAAVCAIEEWFDATMDRFTGLYRRFTSLIVAGVAVVVVGALNADSIALFENFQCNSAVRTSIAAAAGGATRGSDVPTDMANISRIVFDSLPFSWYGSSPAATCKIPAEPLLVELLGLLLTVVALSLGAPFWFDLLKTVMNVRNAGAVPQSTTSKSG